MPSKERAAMQQALEALREYRDTQIILAPRKAIEALREALAEPQVDWKEEALRLGGLNAKHVGELRKLKAEQQEQEPVAVVDSFYIRQLDDELELGTKLYAHPVRTKDLTDDEIDEIESEILMGGGEYIDVIRAVIAAYKEKNK